VGQAGWGAWGRRARAEVARLRPHLEARECLMSQSMVMSMLTWFLAEME